ncbi:hypothetical protein LSH36_414g03008 [Paralvinella palmiformis]|uniref:Carbohydrate sulfotransferase n=1 Tax=Paralvinella palmiformis TaxID=53620 RepID=A0AAD9N0A0_9ANNE|nr:hypothetical protein LSH36_414g03008 [Paralvinella palmiformis]
MTSSDRGRQSNMKSFIILFSVMLFLVVVNVFLRTYSLGSEILTRPVRLEIRTPGSPTPTVWASDGRLDRIRRACATYRRNPTLRRRLELDDGQPLKSLLAASFLIADDRHRVIYCSIPKVGCSTFKLLMARSLNGSGASVGAVHIRPLLASIGLYYLNTLSPDGIRQRLEGYFKFLVVRHPFDRLISAYADKMANPERNMMNVSRIRRRAEARFRNRMRRDSNGQPLLSLSQFLELVGSDRKFLDKHWMSYMLLCQPCRVRYDHVIRLETLGNDIGPILDRLNYATVDAESKNRIPRENSARMTDNKLDEVFHRLGKINPDIVKNLLNVYRYDLDTFGYTWNSSSGAGYVDVLN